jgi:hypothetical protein
MQYLVEFDLNIPDGESEYERNLFRSEISAPRRQEDHTGVWGNPFSRRDREAATRRRPWRWWCCTQVVDEELEARLTGSITLGGST